MKGKGLTIRLSEKEKEIIKNIAEKEKKTITDLIKERIIYAEIEKK